MRLEKLKDHAEISYTKSLKSDEVIIQIKLHGQHEFQEKAVLDTDFFKIWDQLKESYIFLADGDKEREIKGKKAQEIIPRTYGKAIKEQQVIKSALLKGKIFPDYPTYQDKLTALKVLEKRLKRHSFAKDLVALGVYSTRQWFGCRRSKNLPPFPMGNSKRIYLYDKSHVIEWLKDEIEYFRTNPEC
jgi:hypothetical protein